MGTERQNQEILPRIIPSRLMKFGDKGPKRRGEL